jgi:hypothetical protein
LQKQKTRDETSMHDYNLQNSRQECYAVSVPEKNELKSIEIL